MDPVSGGLENASGVQVGAWNHSAAMDPGCGGLEKASGASAANISPTRWLEIKPSLMKHKDFNARETNSTLPILCLLTHKSIGIQLKQLSEKHNHICFLSAGIGGCDCVGL